MCFSFVKVTSQCWSLYRSSLVIMPLMIFLESTTHKWRKPNWRNISQTRSTLFCSVTLIGDNIMKSLKMTCDFFSFQDKPMDSIYFTPSAKRSVNNFLWWNVRMAISRFSNASRCCKDLNLNSDGSSLEVETSRRCDFDEPGRSGDDDIALSWSWSPSCS